MRRASGRAVVAVAVLAWLGSAGAQEHAEQAPKARFVEIDGYILNLDQIRYVDTDPGIDASIGAIVHFIGNQGGLRLGPGQAKQLVAAIRGAEAARSAKAPAVGVGPGVVAFDDFDGRLKLDWKPVRPDPSHVSLVRNPGKLTITTQRGSIHGEQPKDNDGTPIPARNLYLIDNPLPPEADFVLTTVVSGFTPGAQYQQAGLIAYDDDDNYVKWGYEYNWRQSGGQTWYAVAEKDAVPAHYPVDAEQGLRRFWLRLSRRGDRYELASSLDGKTYRVHGEAPWAGTPRRLGILAKNGGEKDATELDAAFESFEVRTPARPGTNGPNN